MNLFIVVRRYSGSSRWACPSQGEFTERRLADNFIEIQKVQGDTSEWAIVEGRATLWEPKVHSNA